MCQAGLCHRLPSGCPATQLWPLRPPAMATGQRDFQEMSPPAGFGTQSQPKQRLSLGEDRPWDGQSPPAAVPLPSVPPAVPGHLRAVTPRARGARRGGSTQPRIRVPSDVPSATQAGDTTRGGPVAAHSAHTGTGVHIWGVLPQRHPHRWALSPKVPPRPQTIPILCLPQPHPGGHPALVVPTCRVAQRHTPGGAPPRPIP